MPPKKVDLQPSDFEDRSFGLTLSDIESITSTRPPSEIETGVCAICERKMFRVPDYTGQTLVWNHKSTGYPQSYQPEVHNAQPTTKVDEHDHTWSDTGRYSICVVLNCGARKMPPAPAISPGVFIASKDINGKPRIRATKMIATAKKKAEGSASV